MPIPQLIHDRPEEMYAPEHTNEKSLPTLRSHREAENGWCRFRELEKLSRSGTVS